MTVATSRLQATLWGEAQDNGPVPETGALADHDITPGTRPQRHHLNHGAWVDHQPFWLLDADARFFGLTAELDWRAERRQMYDRTVDGKKKSTPPPIVNAAKKIFRQLCKSQNKKGPDCKFNFTIVETTREVGADGHLVQHNERTYIGKIVKKKKATKRKIGKRTVTFKYDTIVDYVPMEDAKEMKGGRQLHFLA